MPDLLVVILKSWLICESFGSEFESKSEWKMFIILQILETVAQYEVELEIYKNTVN